jgi:2-keto-4-pentenoate hydratase/2-oxohepta-3-ene-1,7-dioic acid hydratase in catechol pathway
MRLIRFGPLGGEKPGLWRAGRIVDLRAIFPDIPDVGEDFFRRGWLKKVAALEAPGTRMNVRLGAPVGRCSKIICLGLNYYDHSQESGHQAPERPLLFGKAPNALCGPQDPILLPASSGQVDWEVELAVVIGTEGKRIQEAEAFDYIAGFSIMNDVSGREAQFGDGQWFRGKSFDSFAPMGPVLVTPDEIADPHALKLEAIVDGVRMQTGTTADMIFKIPEILAYVSQDMTLTPGDVISTGTPSGVGIFRDPPITLGPGNVVTCRIENIGELRNEVMAQDEKSEARNPKS